MNEKFAIGIGFLALVTCGACSALPSFPASPRQERFDVPSTQVAIVAGSRTIDDANGLDDPSFSNPVDVGDHTALGFEYNSIGETGWGWESGIAYSAGDDDTLVSGVPVDVDLRLLEITLGGRYTYTEAGNWLPYVGGGIDFVIYEIEASSGGVSIAADESDSGFYAHAGVNYLIGDTFMLGVDLRGLFGTSDDLDYTQTALVIGWAF